MNLCCPHCQQPFGYLNSPREARLLPCGDTYCAQCINNLYLSEHDFLCFKCGAIVSRDRNLPPNKLYYEAQVVIRERLARANWDNPYSGQKEVDPFSVDYQAKCLNPFCTKLRYQNETVSELFCSRQCKYQHEQLYSKRLM